MAPHDEPTPPGGDAVCPTGGLPPQAAGLFRVLADPSRLKLLRALAPGPLTAGELAARLGWRHARLAAALSVLAAHGLVAAEPPASAGDGPRYRVADAMVAGLVRLGRAATP